MKKVGSGAAIIAGVLFTIWPLGFVLNPDVDPVHGYLSELAARDQPYSLVFRGSDLAAGAAAVVAALLVLRGGREFWSLVGWLGLAVFGAATVTDALLPMDCAPSIDAACAQREATWDVSWSHHAHAVSSTIVVIAVLVSAFGLSVAAVRTGRWPLLARVGQVFLALHAVAAVLTLVAILADRGTGVTQRVQISIIAAWLVTIGIALARERPAVGDPGELVGVAGTMLHVVRDGAGEPALVLSAGLAASWLDWDPVVPPLSARHALVRFDRPGLGLSPAAGRPTLRGEADRLAALIDRLELRRPVVVAHSEGGFHAEAFARLYPDRLSGLVLVDPSCEPDVRPRGPLGAAVNRALLAGAGPLAAVLGATGLIRLCGPGLRNLVARQMSQRRIAPGQPALVSRVYGSARVAAGSMRENLSFRDMAVDLIALRAGHPAPDLPVVVLTATGDLADHAEAERWRHGHEQLAAAFPRGRHEVLPDARHLVAADRPDAVVEAVAEVSAAAGPDERERQGLPDVAAGQHHDQAVDAHAEPA